MALDRGEADFDVVVVGAGPAGSTTALFLARRGFRTLLVEEHPQVGRPVHCSGLVTPRTVTLAGVGPDLVLHQVGGMEVRVDGASYRFTAPEPRAIILDRAGLDAFLARQAQEAGADLWLETRALGVQREDPHHLRLLVHRRGREVALRCRLVIAADGSSSTLRRAGGIPPPPEAVRALGGEVALQEMDRSTVQVVLDPSVAPGWFGWLIPAQEGVARIGVGTTQRGVSPRALLEPLFARLPALRGASILRLQGGLIPLPGPRPHPLVGDGLLLVGDAGGQVKPFSGGGIFTSLMAARWGAVIASQALVRGDCTPQGLAPYERFWRSALGRHLRVSASLRRLALDLGPRDLHRAVATLHGPALRRLVEETGDIDFPDLLFRRLLSPRALWTVLTTLPLPLWPRAVAMAVRWAWACRPWTG